jgi:hypothetical protein
LDLATAQRDHSFNATAVALTGRLRAAIHEAHRLGYWQTEYEGRLVLAEIEAVAGRANVRPELRTIEAETRAHGYEWMARQAVLQQAALR